MKPQGPHRDREASREMEQLDRNPSYSPVRRSLSEDTRGSRMTDQVAGDQHRPFFDRRRPADPEMPNSYQDEIDRYRAARSGQDTRRQEQTGHYRPNIHYSGRGREASRGQRFHANSFQRGFRGGYHRNYSYGYSSHQRPTSASSERRNAHSGQRRDQQETMRKSRELNPPSTVTQNAADPGEQPEQSSGNSQNVSQGTSLNEVASNQLVPSPIPAVTPANMNPSTLAQDVGEKQPEPSSQGPPNVPKTKKEDKFSMKLIQLVRKYPNLYDVKDPNYRNGTEKRKSWDAISQILGLTAYDCRDMWNKLRVKNTRKKKELAEGHQISEEDKQLLESMRFVPIQARTYSHGKSIPRKDIKSSKICKSMDQIQSKSAPRSVPDHPYHSDTHGQILIQQLPTPEQSFADSIAVEMQQYTPLQRTELKSQIWQVFAKFGKSV